MQSVLLPPQLVVSLSKLRADLSQFRRLVQGGEIVSIEYYRQIIGYLVPLSVAEGLKPGTTLEMGLGDFRAKISESWEAIDAGGTDCIWLTSHGQRKIAFVSPRIYKQ
jgi:hypothetical protein